MAAEPRAYRRVEYRLSGPKEWAMKLASHQLRVISHPAENPQAIACAGSGKRVVVARRVVNRLKAGPNYPQPRDINAFSFNENAPAEMNERIVERCGALRPRKGAT